MTSDDCKNPTLPAYLNGACTNGSKSPSCSVLPPQCIAGGPKGTGMGPNICAVATSNDDTKINGRVKYQLGCPQGYDINFIRHDFAQDGTNFCKTDADCNKGTTAGKCEIDPEIRYQDGGVGLSCRCDAHSGKTQCPNDIANNVATECKVAASGRTSCIESVVCVPPAGNAYQAPGAPNYGCGL
jgi:hypothetical protein